VNFANLLARPRAFFSEQADSLGWAWPIAGFYLFAFALYFQNYIVPGYHVPFYVVIYIVAWFPALMVALGLFVLLVLFWYWPASMALAEGQDIGQSTKIVGIALLVPAILFSAALVVLAVLNGNDVSLPYRPVILTVHAATGLWALKLIVVGATVTNKLNARRTALFVLWLVLLAMLAAAVLFAIAEGR
jgi:hypothetical protein